jgi:hypothetical protein
MGRKSGILGTRSPDDADACIIRGVSEISKSATFMPAERESL